jgi:predicted permease
LRAALLLCPIEFRSRFGAQIAADQREYRGIALFGACWNVVLAGIAMRGENLARDVVFALRSLSRSPGYALVTVLAFGLAIGANVAVASVLDAVVLRPLPFAHSDRLVMLSQGPDLRTQISYRNARDIQARSSTLEGVGLLRENGATLTGRGRPQYVTGWTVDGTYFSVLGVPAQLGRTITSRDLGTSNIDISDRAWRRYFNADPHVLGKPLRMDGRDYTVVGVMPAAFRDPVPSGLALRDYWSAVDPHSILAGSRVWTGFHGVARLAPHAGLDAARADAKRILDADAAKDPQDFIDARGATLVPMLEGIVGNTVTLLWMLYAAVGMVLLIACVNIANLTMARIGARERELVVRRALGAGRHRIIAQLMTELALLALAGGIAGAAIAYGTLHELQAVFSQVLPRWEGVSLNVHVLAYALLLVIFTALVTGLLPVFVRTRDMATALKNAGRNADRGAGGRTRAALVVVEVALAVAVVVSAGLCCAAS